MRLAPHLREGEGGGVGAAAARRRVTLIKHSTLAEPAGVLTEVGSHITSRGLIKTGAAKWVLLKLCDIW